MAIDVVAMARMTSLVESICASEQTDMMRSAEAALIGLLNGAVALRHLRMYPNFAAEAVVNAVTHKPIVGRKGTKRNV